MTNHSERREFVAQAWRSWCRTLEESGISALNDLASEDELDLAEGLRHLGRVSWVHLLGAVENKDSSNPYFWRSLDPHMKMGGDNPQGLYLTAPLNGTDTFRITGSGGKVAWMSLILGRSPAARTAGLPPYGQAAFSPEMTFAADGSFELFVSPERQGPNWIGSDEFTQGLLIRQFFGSPRTATPYDLKIENVTAGGRVPEPLTLDTVVAQLGAAGAHYAHLLPMMLGEQQRKSPNSFATDIGDPTSKSGGVPGGNAVTARWQLEPHQALLVEFTPPTPCPYWDVQVGNIWYESFHYRQFFSGLTHEQAHVNGDGSVTLVLSEQDPGTANWLETAQHRQGHIAVRWQLTDGKLPIPRCTVVDASEVAERTGLPRVDDEERRSQREGLRISFNERFGI